MRKTTKTKIFSLVFFGLGIAFGLLAVVHSPGAVGPALASMYFSGGLSEAIRREEAKKNE